jgi:geranylgeranyl pyrophosphate synthase
MSALRDSFPLGSHRASLARYLRQIVFRTESVAGEIIQERLAPRYVGDPLRPALVLWACDAAGGDLCDAMPVAAAFDLFDRFLLLHAELTNESASVVARYGLGQSLNAGDAFLALAFRSLAVDVSHPQRRLAAAQLVAQAVLEAIDEGVDRRRNATLTAAALRAGSIIAGAPEPIARAFEKAGRLLVEEPVSAAAALRAHTSGENVAALEEVARYVAQRAA